MGVEALRGDRGRGPVQFPEPVERGIGRSGGRVVVEPGEFVGSAVFIRRGMIRGRPGCLAVVLDERLERAADGGWSVAAGGGVAACSGSG